MRLGTVRVDENTTRAAVEVDDAWALLSAGDVGALVARDGWRSEVRDAIESATGTRVSLADTALCRPLLRPSKVVCCGLNYRDHIAETGREEPKFPTLFAKFADTLADPYSPIQVRDSGKVDWEAELAVVIGETIERGTRSEASRAILGYTVANDISMRDWQARTLQWFQGKAWDATTPLGPSIVTADAISPTDGLAIETRLGDEVVQRSNTRELVFDAADLVAYVSRFTILRPGDLILTGTPGGVGLGRTPQRWLADGDVLSTRIEGIGETRNAMQISPA